MNEKRASQRLPIIQVFWENIAQSIQTSQKKITKHSQGLASNSGKITTYFAAPVFVYNRVSFPNSNKSKIRYLEVFWLSIQSFGTPSPVWIFDEPMHISFSATYFWILDIFLGIIRLCGINKWPNMTPQISRNLIKDWYHGMYSLSN